MVHHDAQHSAMAGQWGNELTPMNKSMTTKNSNLAIVLSAIFFWTASSALVTGQTEPRAWEVGKPVVYELPELEKGRFAPETAKEAAALTGYLETPVVVAHPYGDLGGVVIKEPLPPGRYQATFEIGAQPYTKGDIYAGVEVVADKPMQFRGRITPTDFPAKGFLTKSIGFYIPPGAVKHVEVKPGWLGKPDAESFRLRQLSVTRMTGPFFIAGIRTSKVLYTPGEAGTVKGTLFNGSEQDQTATLALSEEVLLDQNSPLATQQVTVPAGESVEVDIPFEAGTQQFGRAFRVELQQDGKVIDGAADVAAVSDHLWYVALGAPSGGILAQTGPSNDYAVGLWAESTRTTYSNWMEKAFWAPDDWGELTPTAEEWVSGQAVRYENNARIKLLIQAARENGIRAITYGKGIAGGTAGLELARRKPDWFMTSRQGIPLGRAVDPWDFDHWDDIKFHIKHYHDFTSVWFYNVPDLRQLEILDHGINELIEASKQFGWEGVRFDGHFSAGNDAMSTRNMQRMKKRLLEAYPDYSFGYNIGSPLQYLDGVPHEIREAAAGGGHWMNEGINSWLQQGSGKRYESWRDFAGQESRSGELVRRLGGTYHFIYGLHTHNAIQSLYKFVIGTAAGAHPVYGGHTMAAGSENWGRFLTRWSALVWHPDLRLLEPEETILKAQSSKPVWDWMANEWVQDKTRRLVVTHLFNPPPSDDIHVGEPQSIVPVTDLSVRLTVPKAEQLEALYLVQPDAEEAVTLTVDGEGQVKLPPLQSWAMVVAELRGNYTPLAPLPQFTEEPDPVQVAAGMAEGGVVASADPLRPEEKLNTQEQILFSESESVTWSVKQTPRLDDEASGGQAASYDAEMKGGTMAGYFWDLVPGHYKATARIKVINPSPTTSILFHAYAEPERGASRQVLRAVDFGGEFRETSVNVSYYGNKFVHVFVQGGVTNPDEVVLLDWTKLELEERYTDEMLLAEMLEKPPPITQVGPASRVLLLRGLHNRLYRVEDALKQALPGADITALYERDEPEKQDFSQFGTLVLINYALPPVAMRHSIREWVKSGGRLLVFGGRYTLAQANWKDTFLEELLPATLSIPPDVKKLPESSLLDASKQPLEGQPKVYYAHEVQARENAKVIWQTGTSPILIQHPFGKGSVTLFAGTVLGEGGKDETPFWEWEGWQSALANAIK